MRALRPWLIWAIPFGVTAALAPMLGLLPTGLTLKVLLVGCFCAGSLVLIDERRSRRQPRTTSALRVADLAVRSLVGGAFLLLIGIAFYPPPAIGNFAWMVGVPLAIALCQPRRSLGVLVSVVALSWLSCGLIAFMLGVPLD